MVIFKAYYKHSFFYCFLSLAFLIGVVIKFIFVFCVDKVFSIFFKFCIKISVCLLYITFVAVCVVSVIFAEMFYLF
jgi:hypothetical protein